MRYDIFWLQWILFNAQIFGFNVWTQPTRQVWAVSIVISLFAFAVVFLDNTPYPPKRLRQADEKYNVRICADEKDVSV